jgi:hypothetical protein
MYNDVNTIFLTFQNIFQSHTFYVEFLCLIAFYEHQELIQINNN